MDPFPAVIDSLRRRGIHSPHPNWVRACIDWLRQEEGPNLGIGPLMDLVYEQWLHSDISDTCGTGSLPTTISTTPNGRLDNTHLVQVVSCIDVSTSAYSQLMTLQGRELDTVPDEQQQQQTQYDTKPSRMLHMTLTDGITTCTAMEYTTISQLPNMVIPGTKLSLCGPINYRLGTLLLTGSHVTVLGGAVERLVQENSLKQVLARELNREDLIDRATSAADNTTPSVNNTQPLPLPSSSSVAPQESIVLLTINRLMELLTRGAYPPTVYIKGSLRNLDTHITPTSGVWSLGAILVDNTGEIPMLLGNGPLEILIGYTANEFQFVPQQRREEGMRKCRDVLYNIHCVMELQLPERGRGDRPVVTRLLDV